MLDVRRFRLVLYLNIYLVFSRCFSCIFGWILFTMSKQGKFRFTQWTWSKTKHTPNALSTVLNAHTRTIGSPKSDLCLDTRYDTQMRLWLFRLYTVCRPRHVMTLSFVT